MGRQKISILTVLVSVILILSISGCRPGANVEKPEEIIVAAAANMQYAFLEMGEIFTQQTGANVTFNFGSSGQLKDQIVNGAPFDVFASANTEFVDALEELGLTVPDTKEVYAIGRIVLATKKDSGFPIDSLAEVTHPKIIKVAIANPDHAPYGKAGKEALISAGIWDEIQEKLVFGNNISDTLTFVATGNADVGIIALSIADENRMDYTLLDRVLHEPLEQSLTVVRTTNNEELARAFAKLVLAEEGQAVLEKYGFEVQQ